MVTPPPSPGPRKSGSPTWWNRARSMFSASCPAANTSPIEHNLLQIGGVDPLDRLHVSITDCHLKPDPETGSARSIHSVCVDYNNVFEDSSCRKNIVLCHGFGAGLGFYCKNMGRIASLVRGSRVWAVDWLGMGLSSRPPFPLYTEEEIQNEPLEHTERIKNASSRRAVNFFLDAFEEWRRRQAGLDKMILVGHSLGGYLSTLYALKYPEHVERLILASPVGLPPSTTPDYRTSVTGVEIPNWLSHMWQANYTPQWLLRTLGPLGRRFAYVYVTNRFPYLSASEQEIFGSYLDQISSLPGSGEYALNAILAPGAWAREPLHHHLPDLKMPCCFLFGSYDWMDYEHAVLAAEHMNVPCKIIRVDHAGHQLFLDNDEAFNRYIAFEAEQYSAS